MLFILAILHSRISYPPTVYYIRLSAQPQITVAVPDLQIRGGGGGGSGYPDQEIKGGEVLKIFFWPFGTQFGPKINGGELSPRSATE